MSDKKPYSKGKMIYEVEGQSKIVQAQAKRMRLGVNGYSQALRHIVFEWEQWRKEREDAARILPSAK